MEDYSIEDIDLRPYLRALLNKWYWIVGLGFLAGILAYGASLLLLSPTYEATALVSFTEFQQRVEFDQRIVTVEEDQPLRVYPEIAVSDELLEKLREETPAAALYTVQRLRSFLEASAGADPSILRLTARGTDPKLASEIANGWAEQLVSWVNKASGESGEEQLQFFELRLADAAAELRLSEEAYSEYQAENRSTIMRNEYISLQETHAGLLAKQGEIERLVRDIDSLLAISQGGSPDDRAAAGDQFTALVLRLRAFGGPASAENTTFPWQLQVNADDTTGDTGPGLEDQMLDLRAALEIQAEQTEAAIAEIEPQILSLQQEMQEARATESLLQRNLELATDTHLALARTVEEKRITSQDDYAGVSLTSLSSPPTSPVGPKTSLNALAAFIGVALLAVFVIILLTWWQTSSHSAPAENSQNDSIN